MPASDKPQAKADQVGNVPEQTGLALTTDGKGEIHLEPSTATEPVLSTVQVVSSLNVLHDANTFTPAGEAHLPGVDIVNAEPAETAVKPEVAAQAEPAVAAEVGSSAAAGMTLDRLMSMTAQKADHAETAATVQSQEQGSLERLIAVVEKANDGKPVLGTGEGFESRALFPGDSTVSKVSEKVVRGILDDQKKVEGVKTEEPTTIYVEPAAGDLKPGHDAPVARTGAAASPVELPGTITLLEQAADSFHPVATERSAENNKRLADIVNEIPVVRAPVENTGSGEGFQSRSLFPGDSAVSLVTTANMDKILNRQPEAPAGETQMYVRPAKDDLAASTLPEVHAQVADSQNENSLPPVDRAPVVASLARLATAIGEEARPETVASRKVETASPVEPLKNVLVGATVRASENQIIEGQGFQDRSLFPGDSHESVVSQGQIEKIVNTMALPVVRKAESTAPVVVASGESAQAPLTGLPAARAAEGDRAPAAREVVVSDTPIYVASAPADLGPGTGARSDKPASDGKLPSVASAGSGASDNKLPVITPAASPANDSPIARALAVIVDNTPVTHADASPLPAVASTVRTIAGVEVVAAKPEAIGTGFTPRVLFPGDSGTSAVSDDTARAIHLSSAPVDEKGAILPAAERYVMKSENDLGSTFGATIASLLGNGSPDKVRPADSSQPLPAAHAAGASDNLSAGLPAVLPASLPPAMRAIVAATVEVGEHAIDTTRPAAAPAPESLLANLTSIVTKAPEPKEGTGFQGVATYPGDSSKSKVSVAVLETLLADNTTIGGYVRPEAGDLDRGKGARLPVSPETAGSMVAALVEGVVRSSSPELPAVRTDVATLPAVKPETVLPATHTIASLVSNEFTPREAFPGDSAVSRVTPETMTVLARAFQNSPSRPFVEAQPGDLAVVLPSVHTQNSAGETSLGNIVAGAVRETQENSPIVTALTSLVGIQGNHANPSIPANAEKIVAPALVVASGNERQFQDQVALADIKAAGSSAGYVNQPESRVAENAAAFAFSRMTVDVASDLPVSFSSRASAYLARTSVDGAASADSLNLNTSFVNTSAFKLSSASTIDWSAGFRTDAASYMVSGKSAQLLAPFESQAQVHGQAQAQSPAYSQPQRQIERGSDLIQFTGDVVKVQPVTIDLAPLGAYQAFVSKAEPVAQASTSGDAPSVKFSLGTQSVRSDVGVAVKLDSVRYIALPIVIDQGVINIRLDGQVKHYGIQGTALVGTITGSINGGTGTSGTTIAQANGTVINISIDPLTTGTRVESTTVKADAQKTDLVGTRPESTKTVQASEFIVQATRGAMTPVIAIGIVNAIKGGQSLPPGLTIENGVVTLRHNGEVFFFPGLAAALKFAQVLGLAGESQDEDEDQIAQQVSVGREKHVVEAGDTIASIAKNKLGDARFGDLIITINRSEVVYRMVDGVRTPFIYPTQVLWLPSAAECRVFSRHFFNGKYLVGGVANGFVASEEYSNEYAGSPSDFGHEPAVKTIPVVSGQPSGPLGSILDRVRFAGGRPSVDLLSPQSVGQLSQQKFYEVQDGDSLKTIAAGNSSMNSQHYWKLIAQVNGMSTELDENGNPVMALVAGQHILMPTEREIASYRANTSLPRPVVLTASQPEMGRVQDNFSPTVITSEVEVRQYASNCRLVVIDFPSAPSDFTLNLQVIEAGLWTTIAAYESRTGRSVKTTFGRDGVTSSMVLNLPATVVKQMAVEDFSRNWASHIVTGNRVSGPYLKPLLEASA
ncbi:MAG: hypothetical protein AB7W16_19695 [Candidatus Obscuribacterales bacterium]